MKKTACCLFALFTTFCAGELFAGTTLSFPKTVDLLAVNGKEVSRQRGSIQLPDGDNQLLMRLVVDVGRNFDAEMEYSDLIILAFSATDRQLQLIVPEIKSTLEMRVFNRDPEIKLLAADNTPLPFARDKLIKEGFQLGRDYEQELAEYNNSNAPAALATLVSAPNQQAQGQPEVDTPPRRSSAEGSRQTKQKQSQAESPAVSQQKTEAEPPMTKEMLRYWYEKADKKTRQEFLQDIEKNN